VNHVAADIAGAAGDQDRHAPARPNRPILRVRMNGGLRHEYKTVRALQYRRLTAHSPPRRQFMDSAPTAPFGITRCPPTA
jgi:hypothetical protein